MAAVRYRFDGFELDPAARRLTHNGAALPVADRHLAVLEHLVVHAGATVSKDALIDAAWSGVAVTDNSLEQAVSALRRVLARAADTPYIETVPRQGYRFAGAVTRVAARQSDQSLDALLAPHRAWLEGRAALESLERQQIVNARQVFAGVLAQVPEQALAHIGLANACAMLFETTRADPSPDAAALAAAVTHAREACRLDPESAEAWATLGFVSGRIGQHADAVAALRRAVALEPDNWRHHFRLSYVGWGEERLRSARRTLALLPGFPLAHWMVATVHVARNVLDQAAQELDAGIAVQEAQGEQARFSAVGLYWLRGLVQAARGDLVRAQDTFERELACEATGHLYARECCANTWYAIGALALRQSRLADARLGFAAALERIPAHPLARMALDALSRSGGEATATAEPAFDAPAVTRQALGTVDAAFVHAAALVLSGDTLSAARSVEDALAQAPAGNAGWLLPVEPLLHVTAASKAWAAALARLRARAS